VKLNRTTTAVLSAAVLLATAGAAPAPSRSPAPAGSSGGRTVIAGSRPDYAVTGRDLGAVAPGRTLSVRLYLGTRDPAALDSFLRAVSDPGSRSYRHFLTPAEYQRRFALTAAQRRAVTHWLTAAGLRVTADTTHYLQVSGSERAVAKALGTGIHLYDTAWGALQAPAGDVSVPSALSGDVVALDGLSAPAAAGPTAFRATAPEPPASATRPQTPGRPQPGANAQAADTAACSGYFGQQPAAAQPPAFGRTVSFATCPYTPAQLRRAYGAGTRGATGKGRTIAIVDAYGSPTMAADADRFAAATGDAPFRPGQYRQQVDPARWTPGAPCAAPASWAGEQALDVEMAHAYAPDADVRYIGADSCLDGDLMDAEASVIDTRSADIISNSWAEIVHARPGHLTPGLVSAWNMLFEQAAAEGIGVYFAAGDCGDSSPAAAATGLNCDHATTEAQADFPSGSPWVTSVGGTALATDRAGNYAWETSMGDLLSIRPGGTGAWAPVPGVFAFGGGGGRSDFPQPWYQRSAVPARLADVGRTAHRVTPDVSLEGDGALPVLIGYTTGGKFELMGYGGTSAACPGFAAVQADAEQETGRSFGFADPLLYSLGKAGVFHDVTGRPGGTAAVRDMGQGAGNLRYLLYTLGQDFGLPAAPGYDAATGLGSPDAAYLRWFRVHG
jgi:subtilase family serine protease